MAKWYPSSLIADIRGRLRNDVYTYYRGVHIIRNYNPNPYNPQTERQQEVRGNFSTVASCWWGLPVEIRNLWEKYASMSSSLRTGIGAYYRHNLRLLSASSEYLPPKQTPPHFPDTPQHIQGFTWSFTPGCNCYIQWDEPQSNTEWIVGTYRLNWDYAVGYNIYWKQIMARLSAYGFYLWTHPISTGNEIFIRLESMDEWGRRSPLSHYIKKVVP